jgi:hypothetical protein
MKLDDCYLKDIGIARCEIQAVVRQGRYHRAVRVRRGGQEEVSRRLESAKALPADRAAASRIESRRFTAS